jgi:enoyl-CoA hydratase/carnithine racemase
MSQPGQERVTCTIDDGVADVRLNRPDKRNALDGPMFRAVADAGERLKSEPGVRVVVLSGVGPSFCAGLDFGSFQQMAGGERPRDEAADGGDSPASIAKGAITHLGQQICWVWQELPVPVIAAVHGHALGGGLQLALGADIRFCAPDAQLSVREVHWGLVPDMTGTYILRQLVRPDVAKELVYTAKVISGTEAHELGLVTHLTANPFEDAMDLAREIAGRSPAAVRGSKALLNRAYAGDPADQFAEERRVIGSLIGQPDQIEAVMANFERRPPVFQG